jgi:hypothetical protein
LAQGSVMDVMIEGRIKGAFRGWSRGSVFVLDHGSCRKWQQVEDRDQFRSSFRPKARVLRDGSRHYLDVEGMDEMVEVKKA